MGQRNTTPAGDDSATFEARPRVISGDDTDAGELEEYGMQHGGTHGPAKDDAFKRITRSHPLRDIPRIESIDPLHAPSKE